MILTLAILGTAICGFLLTVLAAKRPFRMADGALLFWLAAQAGAFTVVALASAFPAFWPLILLSLGQFLLFSLGPAQLTYARASAGLPLGLGWQGAALLLVAVLVTLMPMLTQVEIREGAMLVEQPPAWLIALPPAALVLSALWPLLALRIAARLHRRAKDRYSNLGPVDPGWIRIWAFSSLIVLAVSLLAYGNSFVPILPLGAHVAGLLCFQILQVVYVAHRGLTRPGIFMAGHARAEPSIDRAAAEADFASVRDHLGTQKPFLDPDLTAPRLADALGWAPERLTQAIRIGGDTNFHDAVLRARLAEMERLARDPVNRRVTTLALGFDAGFGSKSAMYEAFRRELDTSPGAWRRELAQS
jgi:AraC-like DNA-binding protein